MSESHNGRLEAFCDGVFAIALTLLIIEIKIPASSEVHTPQQFLMALGRIAPAFYAFLLSFIVIFISWVSHHILMKMVNKSTAAFIYANGFLLLTIVFVPFPSYLLGEYLNTPVASYAIACYTLLLTIMSLAWTIIYMTIKKGNLARNDFLLAEMKRSSFFSSVTALMSLLATIIAFWLPNTVIILTSLGWVFWLFYGIWRSKRVAE